MTDKLEIFAHRTALTSAHKRYAGYRDAAYALAWEDTRCLVPKNCDLRLMPIDERALGFWRAIQHLNAFHVDGNFPWEDIFNQVRNSPKRFDLAIWDGQVLCGLCCGMPSKGANYLTVKWLERFETDVNRLSGLIALISVTTADHYANIIGRKVLRIKQPVGGSVESVYQPLGFALAATKKSIIYLERKVP